MTDKGRFLGFSRALFLPSTRRRLGMAPIHHNGREWRGRAGERAGGASGCWYSMAPIQPLLPERNLSFCRYKACLVYVPAGMVIAVVQPGPLPGSLRWCRRCSRAADADWLDPHPDGHRGCPRAANNDASCLAPGQQGTLTRSSSRYSISTTVSTASKTWSRARPITMRASPAWRIVTFVR